MVLLRSLRSHPFHSLSKLKNPSQYPHQLSSPSPSSQFQRQLNTQSIHNVAPKNKKPLDILFKEAVGLSPNPHHSDSENECESDNQELKNKLKKLELELRSLKENRKNLKKETKRDNNGALKDKTKPSSLYAVFTNEKSGKERLRVNEPIVYKELSPDMAFFANHLYKLGYFNDANFLPRNKFDVTCFENNYGRDFLKFAAEKFGRDHQEIAKWLSGSDLKKVAIFGCPSLAKKNIFSAKTLRTFFRIQEDTVCSKCILKQSCKFVNQSVWKGNTKALDLAVVMRVITLYALDSVPPQLVVPDEIKASVSRLMKEVQNLSETVR